jgi:isoquinoline 1-oxidoreductase beta subunit
VNVGDIEAGFAKASKIVEATYQLPYLSHFCMEPGNATAIVTGERAELWCGDQVPDRALDQVSKLTGIPPEKVYVHTAFIGGGFGGRGGWGTTGALQITQVLRIAQALNGRPVKLLWSREEDLRVGDSYRPAGVAHSRRRSILTDGRSPCTCAAQATTRKSAAWLRCRTSRPITATR